MSDFDHRVPERRQKSYRAEIVFLKLKRTLINHFNTQFLAL